MEHANDDIKERLSKLGGQYTPKSIKRVARYLDDLFRNISVITLIHRHCLKGSSIEKNMFHLEKLSIL